MENTATYSKRTSKLLNTSQQTAAKMDLRDVICPICRGIFIEPVTLPCTHTLCLRCVQGTFKHNSLSCPLCRVRVGSWLRSATKSETLINHELWRLIRSRFPKEVAAKRHDDNPDVVSDTEYVPKIISGADKEHHEYKLPLQLSKNKRRQNKAEKIVSEVVIQTIHKEKKHYQLRFDKNHLLVETLTEKQYPNTDKGKKSFDGMEFKNIPRISRFKNEEVNNSSLKTSINKKKCNLNIPSIIHARRHKQSHQQSISTNNLVALEHQPVVITKHNASLSNNTPVPSCSGSKIYGIQSEEEVRVPSDILSRNKKRFGIEVCVAMASHDDKRIGSAESAESHDSINQEIHHFKPIKPASRTLPPITSDGKLIEPNLIKVIPILKRIVHLLPEAPSPSNIKRNFSCSWSAFREFVIPEKIRQDLQLPESERKTSTQSHHISQLSKSFETAEKIDIVCDTSFDDTENYVKTINRVVNGTDVDKKLIDDDESKSKRSKISPNYCKDGILGQSKTFKSSITESKKLRNKKINLSNLSINFVPVSSTIISHSKIENGNDMNIVDSIEQKKVIPLKKSIISIKNLSSLKKNENRTLKRQNIDVVPKIINLESHPPPATITIKLKAKKKSNIKNIPVKIMRLASNTINLRIDGDDDDGDNDDDKNDNRIIDDDKNIDNDASDDDNVRNKNRDEEINNGFDKYVIEEQVRIEKLLLQEREDFEIARRLQAKFDEIDGTGPRTRGSKRALESNDIKLDLAKMKINGKTSRRKKKKM